VQCKIGAYKLKKEAWTEKAASIDKKRKMFEDILNDQDDDLLPSAKALELASPDQGTFVVACTHTHAMRVDVLTPPPCCC
jgi:hypothetical protein